jgi:hypothetical protein
VDFNDLVILTQNYNGAGKSWATGDVTGDGVADFNDLVLLAQRYNTSLPVLPAAAVSVAAAPLALVKPRDDASRVFSAAPPIARRPVVQPKPIAVKRR